MSCLCALYISPFALVAVPLQGKDKIWVKKESQQEGREGRET